MQANRLLTALLTVQQFRIDLQKILETIASMINFSFILKLKKKTFSTEIENIEQTLLNSVESTSKLDTLRLTSTMKFLYFIIPFMTDARYTSREKR